MLWPILLLLPLKFFGQEENKLIPYKVRHYGVEDGLSQGSVFNMLKDNRGFMWFTSYEGLNRFDGSSFKVYKQNKQDISSIDGNNPIGIVEDSKGDLWIGTETCLNKYERCCDRFSQVFVHDSLGNKVYSAHYPFYSDSSGIWYINDIEGVAVYNPESGQKSIINSEFKYSRSNYRINTVFYGDDGTIWLRRKEGLININPNTQKIDYYFSDNSNNIIGPSININSFFEDDDGIIWLGSDNSLVGFDKKELEFEILKLNKINSSFISAIEVNNEGMMFLGTNQDGVFVLNKQNEIIAQYGTDIKHKTQLTNNSGATIYIDDNNIVWINVDPEGIDVLIPDNKPFNKFSDNLFNPLYFLNSGTRCFVETADKKLWIGTQEDGLVLFDPETNEIKDQKLNEEQGFNENHATCFFRDESNKIWIGTYEGLYVMNEDGSNTKKIINNSNPEYFSASNLIWDILQTPDGTIIFSTDAGIYFIPIERLIPQQLEMLGNFVSGDMYLDQKNNLFVSSNLNGFYVLKLDEQTEKQPFYHHGKDLNIKHFYEDSDPGIMWLATNNGLIKLYHNNSWSEIDSIVHYDSSHGLPSEYIYGILPDESGNLWMSTNRGISKFDKQSKNFTNYGTQDGIQGFEFNTNSFLRTKNNLLYFGGTKGFNSFNPQHISSNLIAPPQVQLLSMLVNGEPFESNTYIGETSSISLKHTQNTFTFSFASMDFISGSNSQYRVKLEGYDDDWIMKGTDNSVRYTKVPPGKYTLQIKTANDDGIWNENPTQLGISINPPWYNTWWAYILSAIIVFGLLIYFYRFQVSRKLARQEASRLKELDEFKTKFYDNITHEFRTPLTIILGMTDKLEDAHPENSKLLHLIRKNGKALLDLVNQMLDLSKIRSGTLKGEMIQDDIIGFLNRFVSSSESYARTKNLGLQFHSDISKLIMDFDIQKMETILGNLLSNAFKFTPEYGNILVLAEEIIWNNQNALCIRVKDSGVGMSKEQLSQIFERYYQADTEHDNKRGYGLGLAIVFELVRFLKGKIFAESTLNQGTIFTIYFPISNNAKIVPLDKPLTELTKIGSVSPESSNIQEDNIGTNLPVLLIIEDNIDVTFYLKDCLKNQYEIYTEGDGVSGINKALEITPDIIISDIMMPGKNGFEVCETLKSDQRTSHIPIIMLTAKSSDQDRMKGLSKGADAYLLKPFNKAELEIRLKKLVELRTALQAKYSNAIQSPAVIKDHQTNLESAFLNKLNKILDTHLDDSSLDIALLCNKMNMSRVQIHRKLKALTDKSTSIYIRSYRLNKAKDLLTNLNLNISEIAYQTGFESLSWFTQAYKEEFGKTPSETRK
ncbi:MAG: response regulator [Saprospiraceae bacterium]|nr:response regulator [Saprospiraceae bacterium]